MRDKYETEKSYKLREEFINKNKNKKNVEQLSRIYRNVILLGCKYNTQIMKLIK